MSKISNVSDPERPLPFALYNVSGIVHKNVLAVTWSTGNIELGSTSMDYGLDKSVPNTTPVKKDSEGNIVYAALHSIDFPQTYVDSWHYFRVRAASKITGEELVSEIYKIYINDEFELNVLVAISPPLTKELNFAEKQQAGGKLEPGVGISWNQAKVQEPVPLAFSGLSAKTVSPEVNRAAVNTTETIEIIATVEPIP